jgi:tetratricopeptide (TPR) repeat protein
VLDPYAAFVTGSVFQSDQVADAAVGLERLEYRPATTGAPAKSDWAASLGVKMDDGPKNEKPPVWLTPPAESTPAPAPAVPPDLAPAPAASAGEEIPSWLREAGWHGAGGEAQKDLPDLPDEPKEAEPLAPAEIPDWLQSMAPPGVTGAAAAEPAAPPADAGGLPDWLDEMKSEIPAEPAPEPEKPRPAPQDESVPFGPTGPSKPLGIEDDAMAWLESLAAKQGAKPEELLTRPEDRPAEAPATVARLSDEAAAPSAPRPAPLDESAPFGPTGPSKPLGIEDDAMAWLESLAAKQGAKPEELLTRPEDRPAEAPATVARLSDEAAAPSAPRPAPLDEFAETSAQPAEAKIREEAAAAPPAAGDDTISSWLKNLDETELPAEAPQAAPAEILPTQAPDLPDWLKDLERPAPGAGAAAAPVSDEGLPDWLSGPAAPAPAEESPVWARDEAAPVVEPPAPTIPGEWVPADAAEPVEARPVPAPRPEPVPASRPTPTKPTGSLARIPEKEKDADVLAAAQAALNNSKLDEAIQLYIKLIKKARLLEEVIHDLREAIYRFPVDIIVWQTLGDAYMRANRLQDALDAYTKAEELLR